MAKRESQPDFAERSTKSLKVEEEDDDLDLEEPMQVDGDSSFVDAKGRSLDSKHLELSTNGRRISGHEKVEAAGEPDERNQENKMRHKVANSSGNLSEVKEVKALKPLKPRSYQRELASAAIEGKRSIIICAPTGSGKTLTAALVCQAIRQRKAEKADGEPFKALFVVCLRSLVTQQRTSLSQYLPNVISLGESQFLEDALEKFEIVVTTSQIVVNAVKNKDIDLEKLSLIVFDECHHANLSHPYNQLMRFYHLEKMEGCKRLPQILGLTASLGVGDATGLDGAKSHYITMCANLDCDYISHIRDPKNREELEKYNPKPSPNQIIRAEKRSKDKAFYQLMTELMLKIEKEFLNQNVDLKERGTQQYEGKLSVLRTEAEKIEERGDEMVACQALMNINSAWMMHEELRAKDSLAAIDRYFKSNLKSKPGNVEMTLCEWYSEIRPKIQTIVEQETVDDWPLLKELHVLIQKLFSEGCDAAFSKGIIMANRIQCVDGLMDFLQDDPIIKDLFIRPGRFVGHRHNIETSMTEKEQEKIVAEFRDGTKNLLVATDVAQEGLDIPTCNFVIRYDFVSNEIGSIQSQGRARAKDSKCYLIAYKDSVNVERELKNLSRERLMQEALDTIDDSNSTEELQNIIKTRQEKLYEDFRKELNVMEVEKSKNSESQKYTFHCRRCKALLCNSSLLIKYGCHYICIDEKITERLRVEQFDKEKDLRDDILIGKSKCVTCEENIGSFLKYKRGLRPEGYSFGKDSVMWKVEGKEQYGAIRKWNNVPFSIHEETRST